MRRGLRKVRVLASGACTACAKRDSPFCTPENPNRSPKARPRARFERFDTTRRGASVADQWTALPCTYRRRVSRAVWRGLAQFIRFHWAYLGPALIGRWTRFH